MGSRPEYSRHVLEDRILREGKDLGKPIDLAQEAGFRKPLVKELEASVDDGLLELTFHSETGGPLVSAIEVVPVEPR